MEIKKTIEEIVAKLTQDKNLKAKFDKNPTAVLEELLGVDLPDDQINQIIEGVKAKLTLDNIGNVLGGLFKK